MKKEEKTAKEEKQEAGEKITITLRIEPVLDSQYGIFPKELRKGDQILVKIEDSRDIAQYLSALLGGKRGHQSFPLPTPIEEIRMEEEQRYVLTTRFGPGVLGETVLSGNLKVRLLKRKRKILNLITDLLRGERR